MLLSGWELRKKKRESAVAIRKQKSSPGTERMEKKEKVTDVHLPTETTPGGKKRLLVAARR